MNPEQFWVWLTQDQTRVKRMVTLVFLSGAVTGLLLSLVIVVVAAVIERS